MKNILISLPDVHQKLHIYYVGNKTLKSVLSPLYLKPVPPSIISKTFMVSKYKIQVEMERNRLTSFAVAKEDPNRAISKFCNKDFHCFHLTFSFLNIHKSDFHCSHFNETSPFTEVLWFFLGLYSWSFLHFTHYCNIILFSDFNHHTYTNNPQICTKEIRLLSLEFKTQMSNYL